MSDRDLMRAAVLARMASGELTSADVADLLALSVRQVKRLRKRYVADGAKGIVHRNVSRRSNHARPPGVRQKAMELIRESYSGPAERGPGQRFGPTLAAEHLASDHRLVIPVSTLRGWMRDEGLWGRKRKWKRRFVRRARKCHFGELVQMDGSFHDWLEGRGPAGCLMTMTDDATGTVMAEMSTGETMWSAARLLQSWIDLYGVPRALYTDWKSLYHSPASAVERAPVTQFGQMCRKLGIELIPASSPQAKGRVERTHGTNQDRLIKKLRVKGISTHDEMNRYLREIYLPAHNARFARKPESLTDYHLSFESVRGARNAEDIWCREDIRRLSNDGVIRYFNRKIQVLDRRNVSTKATLVVRSTEDGSLRVFHRFWRGSEALERELRWRDYESPQKQQLPAKKVRERTPRHYASPGPNHPWRIQNHIDAELALAARREAGMQTPTQRP
jgi:hypothetical protein